MWAVSQTFIMIHIPGPQSVVTAYLEPAHRRLLHHIFKINQLLKV